MTVSDRLEVPLGDRSYAIHIEPGALARTEPLAGWVPGREALIITNETVAPLYLPGVAAALSAIVQLDTLTLPDGERYKTLATFERILDALVDSGHSRNTTVIALGGGVVGDVAGFAAACYQRGVRYVQIPTTLLAQVDSSIGGKTAVNHPRGKNMIGAFHQPAGVLIDPEVLATLPRRELAAGLAEVVKYGCIEDAAFFEWLESEHRRLLALEAEALTHAIRRSCEVKARVVAADEREEGLRAILNFGHTFAHAIETHTDYRTWLHGEAVAAGMVLAAELSVRLGTLETGAARRIGALLEAMGLPVRPPDGMEPDRFIELMASDKKVIDARMRFVTLDGFGRARVRDDIPAEVLRGTLEAIARPSGRR